MLSEKRCTICSAIKNLDEFYKDKTIKSGRTAACKECLKAKSAEWRRKNPKPKKERKPRLQGFRLLPENMRKCGRCKEIRETKHFYLNSSKASGYSNRCKDCARIEHRERASRGNGEHLKARRIWSKKNREKLREQDRIYRENNRERIAMIESRRRARKRGLPDTLTENQLQDILHFFDGRCCICDDAYEHMDHFIPLRTEKVGTVLENMVPMCSKCNISKRDYNPFEWIRNQSKENRERFDSLVKYLEYLNGITGVKNYKAHVYNCFK